MNEKIKELAEKVYGGDVHYDDGIFAELIINECAALADNSCQGSESHNEGTVFYYNANIGDKIKQHFGFK